MAAIDLDARIWEETTACWALTSSAGRLASSLPTAAALCPVCAHGEKLKSGRSRRQKVNGGHTTKRGEPHGGSTDGSSLHCMLDLQLGPTWDGRESTYCMWGEVSIPYGPPNGQLKVNRGPRNRNMLSPMAVNQDRWLHSTLLPQPGYHMGYHWGNQHANIVLVMASQHWIICRSWRLGLPGPP